MLWTFDCCYHRISYSFTTIYISIVAPITFYIISYPNLKNNIIHDCKKFEKKEIFIVYLFKLLSESSSTYEGLDEHN